MGLTFEVGLTLKVLIPKWDLLSSMELTIERAYFQENTDSEVGNSKPDLTFRKRLTFEMRLDFETLPSG